MMPSITLKWSKWDWVVVPALLISGIFMAQAFFAVTHVTDMRPPIDGPMKVETVNSPIKQGQNLKVKVTRNKVRDDCPVTSLRYVTNDEGKAIDIPDRAWVGGNVGQSVILVYPTSGLPVDQYVLHVSLSYDCPGFTWNRDQPTVNFRVVP